MSTESDVQKKMEKDKKTKTTKSRRETAVQGTNDSSIVSKCSMAAQGYFDDPYLQAFVSKVTRRAPLIHRGYYIRAKTIDYILRKFLDSNDGEKQIISLGAGFDSAYFRLKSQNLIESTVFYEVDFPEVVKRKRGLIEADNGLLSMIGEHCVNSAKKNPLIELCTKSYKLIGADLSQTNTLEAALKLCEIDFERPTLLLSECVLTYMTRRTASGVIRWAAESFSNAVFVLYEQINPDDAFGLFMQKHFNTVGSPLKSINFFPTIQSQKDRFIKLGWTEVEAMDMNEFYNTLVTSTEHDRIERLEPFDEHEEWNIKCAHYMVLLAYHGSCDLLLKSLVPQAGISTNSVQEYNDKIKVSFTSRNQSFRRFGHGTCQLDSSHVLSFGGFGEQAGKHMRVTDIVLVNNVTMETSILNPNVDNKKVEVSRMHATVSHLQDGQIILVGGRMSPMRLCTQMVSIETNSVKFKLNMLEGDMNCVQEKYMNRGSMYKFVHSDKNMMYKVSSNCLEDAKGEESSTFNVCMNCALLNISTNSDSVASEIKTEHCDNTVSSESESKRMGVDENVVRNVAGKEMSNLNNSSGELPSEDITITFNIIQQLGDIPCPRWRHSMVLYSDKGVETMLLFGGRTQTVFALDDCYKFIPATKFWHKVETSGECPGPCQSHTASTWNNNMVIAGGLNIDLQPVSSVYLFNFDTTIWKKIKCDIYPRYAHTAHVVDDILILIGGVSFSHKPPGVTMVHLPSGNSAEFSLPCADKDNLIMLHGHTSVTFDNNNILLLGGGGNCFSFGTHLNASPVIMDLTEAFEEMKTICTDN